MSDPLGLFEDENKDPLGLFDTEQPKASLGTAIASSFANIGNTADKFLSMQAGSLVSPFSTEMADKLYSGMEDRVKSREQWANPDNQELTGTGKVVGALATLPMQMLTAPFSAADTGQRAIQAGESLGTSATATGIDAAGNALGFALGPGKTLAGTVAKNFLGNAAQDYGTKALIQKTMDTEEGKRQFAPTLEDAVVSGVVGGATAGAMHRSTPKPKAVTNAAASLLDEINAPKPAKDVPALGKETPADYHATEGLDGQRSLFDIPEEGRMPNPYEAVTGDWRIDENGMPVKVDLSMDVANAENPLQRNLWGDELPQKHEQENARNLPEAIDSMDWAHRRGALKKTQLGRELDAPGELLGAAAEARRQGESAPPLGSLARAAWAKKQGGALAISDIKAGYKGLAKHLSELTDKLAWDFTWQNKIKDTLGGDYLKNEDGTPRVMLHGTIAEINGPLKGSSQGFHAGGVGDSSMFTTARSRRSSQAAFKSDAVLQNSKQYPIVIKEGNYPTLDVDAGNWSPKLILGSDSSDLDKIIIKKTIQNKLLEKGMSYSMVEGLFNNIISTRGATETNKAFSDLLRKAGIDGFFYQNKSESPKTKKLYQMSQREGIDARKKFVANNAEHPKSFVTWDENNFKSVFDTSPTKGMNVSKSQRGAVLVDWGKKKNVDQLKKVPGFAEKLKNVGNSMIASPDEAISLANSSPDVSQNVVQKTINQLTKGGIYLKAKVDHPVVHYAVDSFLKADSVSRSLITEKIHNEYLGALRSLSKQEHIDAFTLLNAADLNKIQITPDMITRAGLSEKLSSFLTQHASLMGDSLTKINEARVAAGKKPIAAREAYSAFNMTGDYRKVAYKTIDGKKEVVGVVGANTMGIGKNSLSKLEAALKAKDPAIEFGPLIDKSRTRQSAKGTPHEAFTDVLKTLGEDNPHMKEFLDTLAQVAKDDPTHYMGMDAHTLQKKGVWGMEGRKQWLSPEENAKAFFENQVRYAEGAMQWGELSKAAKDVNDVLRNETVATKHQNAVKLSEDYMYNALGMNPSDIGNGVNSLFNSLFRPMGIGPSVPKAGINMARQVANTWMMSLSPMFLAMNAIQPLAALPGMVAYLRGKGMDSFGIVGNLKAMKTAFNELEKGSLSPMEQGALKYAKDNHVYATDMVEHSNQTEKGAAYYTAKVTQSPAAYVETGTRKTVYLTLVHALHDGGLSVKDGLYEQAARFTDMAMNNYGAMEKPPIYNALGPVGTMAYNLKSFGHNEISRWSLYAREAAQTGNAVPFLTQMATTIAMAGVMGLPFFSQWESLYDQITKAMGNPKSLALDVMNVSEELGKHLDPKAMYALSHGLWSLTGADASTRLGLGDVLPNNAADAAFAGGGKLASMIGSVVDVARQRNEETAQAALYNLAPPIAQGPLDLAMYTKDDLAYSKDPSNLKPTARRNEVDKTMRAIGITGINESVQKTKNYQLGQIDKSLNDIRTKALNTIAQDIFRDRSFDQKTMDKYFVDGQGDPQQFEQQVGAIALKLSLSPEEFAILKDSASKSITKAKSLQRRVQ